MALSDKEKFTMITDKEADLQPLYSRMETDKDLYWLKKYKMKTEDNLDVPHIENVTSNGPRTYADRVISILSGATKTILIKSEILDDEARAEIKDFFDDVNVELDDWLEKMGYDRGVDNLAFSQLALRGSTSWRYESRMEKGKFIPDIAPWDTRWVSFEYGRDGLAWAAYRSARSKWLIREQYGIERTDTPVEVVDLYEKDINTIFIGSGGDDIRLRKHNFGPQPVIYQKTSAGAFIRDGNYLAHDGESIYAPVRDLYPEKNKMMTIMQTLTVASFFGGLQYAGKEGEDMKEKPEQPPYGLRFVVPVEKDGGYKAMPVVDIHNATRLGYNIVETDLQMGSFPPTEFGSLEFPMSAVGLVELGQGRDQRVLPLVDGWARFRQKLAGMIYDQFIQKGMSATFGHSGKKERTYTASKLKKYQGKFEVKYKFTNVSDRDRIAKITMASALGGVVSEDTKRRDWLEMENPDEEQDKLNVQNAILNSPTFQLYKWGQSLLRQIPPDEIGARIIADQLDITLEQLESGRFVPPEKPPAEAEPKQMVPLIGGGGEAKRKSATERRTEIASEVREPV